ncbi:hypothetical protein E1B28_011226 [Marasmius oreades]|uniref:Uncharacterized protein n=1 Tax=Marasmius oreades TaxID=181124 RepID=A0A9P7UPR3_9AGAR|nr:uncharacterized protein E1B28_011226 [Marasmius oreades]KAG7089553.1 hypothetical protein E1B28_011226 [Marasmius oreades]
MFTKSKLGLAVLAVLSLSDEALGRIRLLERDNRSVLLHPRRFGRENPPVIEKLSKACDGQVCGNLAGAAITPLLAAQPECSQQDMADQIIDAAQQFDEATRANMIALAVEYRQAEKNTPPDFTTNPPTPRNSVFCQKAPKNAELNGLVQSQDPANGDIFFDPLTKASVKRGDQPNTFPFGQSADNGGGNNNGTNTGNNNGTDAGDIGGSNNGTEIGTNNGNAGGAAGNSGNSSALPPCEATVTVTVAPTATPSSGANNGNAGGAAGAIGDFGSCSVPEIEFAVGFDNRKETSFQPVDKESFDHGSAQAFNIIAQFVCDTLTNKCQADQTAKDTCKKAQDAGNAATAKTGAQADAFNAAFGKTTNFANVQPIDDQGRPVGSATGGDGNTGTGNTGNSTDTGAGNGTGNTGNSTDDTGAGDGDSNSNGGASGAIGDFGSCSVPEIEFGVGFDKRKETSFQPIDKDSFDHGSAQAFNIIAQFVCDTLTNKCQADQTAKDTCKKAQDAGNAATAKTGAQADAFNAAFGKTTNFADVQPIDDQGRPVGSATGGDGNASTGNTGNSTDDTDAGDANTGTTSNTGAGNTDTGAGAGAGGNLQTFNEALGGVAAPTVTASGDEKFQVEGNDSFTALRNAVVRSCDVQNNKCSNAANASGNKGDLTVANCNAQQQRCIAAAPQ